MRRWVRRAAVAVVAALTPGASVLLAIYFLYKWGAERRRR